MIGIPSSARSLYRKYVPEPLRRLLRAMRPAPSPRESYQYVSRIGNESDNAWIRRSSEIGGWLFHGEHEFLWKLATRSTHGDILEIGTWMGKSACILSGACIDHAPYTKVFCVDTFRMDGTGEQLDYHRELADGGSGTFYQFVENAHRHGFESAVVTIAALSYLAIPHLNVRLRMAFVDGTHDYAGAKRDVELCLPLLENGGILALHDVIGPAYPELTRYFESELLSDLRLRYLGAAGTIVAFEKQQG